MFGDEKFFTLIGFTKIKKVIRVNEFEYNLKIDDETNEIVFYCPQKATRCEVEKALQELQPVYERLLLEVDINKTAKNPEYDDLKLKEIDNYPVIYEEKEEAEEINVKFEHFERYFLVTFPPKKRSQVNAFMEKNLERYLEDAEMYHSSDSYIFNMRSGFYDEALGTDFGWGFSNPNIEVEIIKRNDEDNE